MGVGITELCDLGQVTSTLCISFFISNNRFPSGIILLIFKVYLQIR